MPFGPRHRRTDAGLSRRRLLAGLAAPVLVPALGWALAPFRAVAATAFAADLAANANQLLVAGPAGGRLAQWANLLCPLLGPGLGGGGALAWNALGGADGVTAANQFDAQVAPDGNTAMLLPGAAPLAQLVGDPRAQFDPGGWVAGLAGLSSVVVLGRAPLAELPTSVPLSVLAADPGGADLPMLLGLSLLGYEVRPVAPQNLPGDARDALLRGRIDIACLADHEVSNVAQWQADGVEPLFSLGGLDEAGVAGRDPAFPHLPALDTLLLSKGRDLSRPLAVALRALSAARQLTLGLVLPQLTPASRVAQWRRACADSIASLTIEAIAATESLRFVAGPVAAAAVAAVMAPSGAQLELHQWLTNRLGWRPS